MLVDDMPDRLTRIMTKLISLHPSHSHNVIAGKGTTASWNSYQLSAQATILLLSCLLCQQRIVSKMGSNNTTPQECCVLLL
jgi:hypothetical protein